MKKNVLQKGFTLIELLVVVAIIAMLSGTILVALNSARGKAKDARIKAEMQQLKSQLELYYTTTGSFSNGGANAADCQVPPFTGAATTTANTLIKGIDNDNGGTANDVTCGSSAEAWAVASPLVGGGTWCVDSNGISTGTTIANGTTACPN